MSFGPTTPNSPQQLMRSLDETHLSIRPVLVMTATHIVGCNFRHGVVVKLYIRRKAMDLVDIRPIQKFCRRLNLPFANGASIYVSKENEKSIDETFQSPEDRGRRGEFLFNVHKRKGLEQP